MSIACMSRVWKHSKAKGSELLVLLAIADFAHDDGSNAFPSVPTLAAKSRLSVRAVQFVLRKLEAIGELEIIEKGGRNGSNLYRVLIGEDGAKISPAGEAGCTRVVKPIAPGVVKPVSPNPSSVTVTGTDSVSNETGARAVVEKSRRSRQPQRTGEVLSLVVGKAPPADDPVHGPRSRLMGSELPHFAWLDREPPANTTRAREAGVLGELLEYMSETDIKIALEGARRLLRDKPFSVRILKVRGFARRARDAFMDRNATALPAELLAAIAEGIAA
jgi:hypothetical protein